MKPLSFPGALFALLGGFFADIPAANPSDSSVCVQLRTDLSHLPGWVEQKERYRGFTAEELYGIINGGATKYDKQGLLRGMCVSFANQNNSLEIFFDDFGSSSRAKGMVGIKKKGSSNPVSISHDNGAPAMYNEVIGGCIVYWSQGNYYIEMTLTGYDSLAIAVRDAIVLINSINPLITINK
jgi:hypothetical protein